MAAPPPPPQQLAPAVWEPSIETLASSHGVNADDARRQEWHRVIRDPQSAAHLRDNTAETFTRGYNDTTESFIRGYNEADPRLIHRALRQWNIGMVPILAASITPIPLAFFSLPGTEGQYLTEARALDDENLARLNMVRSAIGPWEYSVFFARVKATWRGHPDSWYDYPSKDEDEENSTDLESEDELGEKAKRKELLDILFGLYPRNKTCSNKFTLGLAAIHDMDGQPILPPETESQFDLAHDTVGILQFWQRDLFDHKPSHEVTLGSASHQHENATVEKTWYRDVLLLLPDRFVCSLLCSILFSTWTPGVTSTIAQHIIRRALTSDANPARTSRSSCYVTTQEAYGAISFVYKNLTFNTLTQSVDPMTGALKSDILRFALERGDMGQFVYACTSQGSNDCGPDESFFTWLREHLRPGNERLPILDFCNPSIRHGFRQLVLFAEGLADRSQVVSSLPLEVLWKGASTVGDQLSSLLLPLDASDSMLSSVEDGRALVDAAMAYADQAYLTKKILPSTLRLLESSKELQLWVFGFLERLLEVIPRNTFDRESMLYTYRQVADSFCCKGHYLMAIECTVEEDGEYQQDCGVKPETLTQFISDLNQHHLDDSLDTLLDNMEARVRWIPGEDEARHLWLPFLRKLVLTSVHPGRYKKLLVSLIGECALKWVGRQPPLEPDDLRRELRVHEVERLRADPGLARACDFLLSETHKTAKFQWNAIQRQQAKHIWRRKRVTLSLDESTTPPTLTVEKRSRCDQQHHEAWWKKMEELKNELLDFTRTEVMRGSAGWEGEGLESAMNQIFSGRRPAQQVHATPAEEISGSATMNGDSLPAPTSARPTQELDRASGPSVPSQWPLAASQPALSQMAVGTNPHVVATHIPSPTPPSGTSLEGPSLSSINLGEFAAFVYSTREHSTLGQPVQPHFRPAPALPAGHVPPVPADVSGPRTTSQSNFTFSPREPSIPYPAPSTSPPPAATVPGPSSTRQPNTPYNATSMGSTSAAPTSTNPSTSTGSTTDKSKDKEEYSMKDFTDMLELQRLLGRDACKGYLMDPYAGLSEPCGGGHMLEHWAKRLDEHRRGVKRITRDEDPVYRYPGNGKRAKTRAGWEHLG